MQKKVVFQLFLRIGVLQKTTGYEADEVIGKNLNLLQNNDKDQKGLQIIRESIKNRVPCTVELRNYKKDGSLFHNLLTISPIFNIDGELIYFAGIQNDITEFKKLQQKSFHEEKIGSMKELLNNISHQWRQPLSLISNLSSGLALKDEMNKLNDGDVQLFANRVVSTSTYLSSILNQFSELLVEEDEELIDLKELFHTLIDPTRAHFIFNCESQIYIDNYKKVLQSIFQNVIENSLDAVSKNERKLVFIDLFQSQKAIEITIKDNGGGVSEENLSKIFEPYYTTYHQSQGKGLGLNIVDTLIDYIGASIDVKNILFEYEGENYKGLETKISIPLKI